MLYGLSHRVKTAIGIHVSKYTIHTKQMNLYKLQEIIVHLTYRENTHLHILYVRIRPSFQPGQLGHRSKDDSGISDACRRCHRGCLILRNMRGLIIRNPMVLDPSFLPSSIHTSHHPVFASCCYYHYLCSYLYLGQLQDIARWCQMWVYPLSKILWDPLMLSRMRSGPVRGRGLHLERAERQTSAKKKVFLGMHTYGMIEWTWFWAEWVIGQRRSEFWNNRAKNRRNEEKMSHYGCLRS